MGCCGGKRQALSARRRTPFAAAGVRSPARKPAMAGEPVMLVFRGTGAYLVAGPRSGTVYRFSSGEPARAVDQRDADALLRTALFSRPLKA